MHVLTRCCVVAWCVALVPGVALAQSPGRDTVSGAGFNSTFLGDTGLWFVPSADVLPAGVLSTGIHVASEARGADAVKASYAAASVAAGIADRAEVFGTWQMRTSIDGRQGRGDLLAGTKIGLLSQRRGSPFALAVRSAVKLPTSNERIGLGTGKADLLTEVVASRRLGRVEVTGSSGLVLRGDPAGVDLPNGIRSGIGLALQAHRAVRVFTEVHGEARGHEPAGTRLVSAFDTPATAAAGLSWNVSGGLSASVGVSRALGRNSEARGVGAAVQLGYRSGIRRPPTPSPALPTPPLSTVADTPPAPASGPAPAASPSEAPAAARDLAFDDVHFDLDRFTLRPDALPILDRAVAALQNEPSLRLQIDGHTCEIGTAEYNLALGDRRANAVREYLVNRGVSADRLQIASFGEERPKHDLSTEATRALNRRAEMRPLFLRTSND